MAIEEVLAETRVTLDEVDLTKVHPDDPSDYMQIKGRIAERLVYQWLQRAGVEFDEDFPRSVNGLRCEKSPGGILVLENDITKHEFDFLFSYEGQFYVGEVKSLKLNGVAEKITRGLDLAAQIFGQDPRMLLFFPQYTNKVRDAEQIERDHPRVSCIDSGYKKKQLNIAVDRFFYSLAGR